MTRTRIPDLLVEKVHLGEATDAERALVLGDPDARARLEALPAQDAAFLAAYPVDEEVRRIEGRARTAAARAQSGANRAVLSAALGPLMAAAVAMMWVVAAPPEMGGGGGPVAEQSRPKGLTPKLRVYRQRPGGPERLAAGAVAREGDIVQLGVVAGSATHGVVLSIDGAGAITVHHPPGGDGPTALRGGELQLPAGYELDDAPEFERFFLVTPKQGGIEVDPVVRAARRLVGSGKARTAPLPLPPTYEQASFLLRKEAR